MLVHGLVKVGYGGNKMRQRAETKSGGLHGHEPDRRPGGTLRKAPWCSKT